MDNDYSHNWSRNIAFHADKVLFPTSVEQVQEIVQNPSYRRLKAIGSRHCFNNIADTDIGCGTSMEGDDVGGDMIQRVHLCLEGMTQIWIEPNTATSDSNPVATVRFQAGVTFTRLMEALEAAGYALQNMPSLPHISVVGGIVTGTHGSGYRYPLIAKSVVALEMVHANGSLRSYSKESTVNFDHYLINLGSLGVIVSVTMELEPHYHIAKGIYLDLPLVEFVEHVDEILGPQQPADFASVFTDWKEPRMNSVWVGQKYDPGDDRKPEIATTCFSAKHIKGPRFHPVPGQDPEHCIATGYGSWTTKLNHFLPDHAPSSCGNEIQAEYFVPYRLFIPALQSLWQIKHKFQDLVQITEFRVLARDDLPMSPAKKEAVVGIHFTLWKRPADEINQIMAHVQAALEPFEFKLHLGKWFVGRGAMMERIYGDDLIELRKLIRHHDPEGRFSNEYLQTCIFNNPLRPQR